jgi:hypothetical protein
MRRVQGDDADTGVIRMPGDRPWESPGPPPWVGPVAHRRNDQAPSRLVLYIGASMVVAAVVILVGLFAVFSEQDSGVAACRAIAEGKAADGSKATAGAKMTKIDYQEVRKIFADSGVPEIRDNGTRFIDLSWQSPDTELLISSDMTRAYTGLAGACAAHGYVIPALGAQ